jgi:ribose 5-phosphate isomerase B
MPKLYIAADHGGFALKEALKPHLVSLGYEVEDCGAPSLNTEDDYPDVIRPCAEKVAKDSGSRGIIIGASGQGEAMVANRVQGVRAAVYYGPAQTTQTDSEGFSLDIITSARLHNHANILSLGARFISEEEAKQAVESFLGTAESQDVRHLRRIAKF